MKCNSLGFLLLYLRLCNAATVTILPLSSSYSCPSSSICYLLSNLYEDSASGFEVASNTTVEFINAPYQLESSILIRDVSNIKFKCSSLKYLCQLHCSNGGGFVFMNISNLTIERFTLYDCGNEIAQDVGYEATRIQSQMYHTFVFGLRAAIFAVSVQNLIADSNIINGSSGYAILGINILGNSSFTNLIVGYSNARSSTKHCISQSLSVLEAVKCQGGSILFHYSDLPYCPDKLERHTLTLRGFNIVKGLDPVGGSYGEQFIAHGSGLGIIMAQSYFDVDVHVLGGHIVSNTALASEGSNLYLRLLSRVLYSTISVRDSVITVGNSACVDRSLDNYTCDSDSFSYTRAVAFFHGIFSNFTPGVCNITRFERYVRNAMNTLVLESTIIDKNLGGGLFISVQPSLIQEDKISNTRNVVIKQCRIRGNLCTSRLSCSAEVFHGDRYTPNEIEYTFTIQNTVFAHNRIMRDILFPEKGVETVARNLGNFVIIAVRNITFSNCTFMNNLFPSLLPYDSRLYFEGTSTFINNTAPFGGAIYLERNSHVFLKPNTQILFEDNIATLKGGAVYIAGGNEANFLYNCPIQVYDPFLTQIDRLGISIKFVNNTALDSGDALYGGQIDLCFTYSISAFLYQQILTGGVIFNAITDFSGQPPSDSLIASDAVQICFCFKNRPDCSQRFIALYQYPGEQFQISLIAVGQRLGAVSAIVFATLGRRSDYRNYQFTGRRCSNANYSIASTNPEEILLLSTENTIPLNFNSSSESEITQILPVQVEVKLIPCNNLTGFMLDKNSGVCTCTLPLRQRNMSCDINSKVITRLPPYWLSNYSNHLLLHDNCAYDYCKPTIVLIIMMEPNISDQCAFNRYGTLCGSCREGMSQVFGTTRCLKCSNIHILYIFLFAVAGIVLVVILFVFNLTVSAGAINGLIFYANIVKINESAFFPPGDVSLFRVFISWLNLDIGIEMCFYNGMDSYAKTWFQFLFPLYLWLTMAGIIVACRFSVKMVRLFGYNSVEVLATIFLLSYTKLLRTVITVFSSTTLEYPDGQKAIWLYDGNYLFGRGSHLVLLFFSLLFLVAVALPYTFLILSVQFLRQYSHLRLLKWVISLMPVFDAYLGPYKHKHGYWTGLLLVLRIILVAVFAFNVLGNPAINLFVVRSMAVLVTILNLGLGGVYKTNSLTALEIFHTANLLILSSATSLIRDGNWDLRYAIYSSSLLALLAFLATVVYQAVHQINNKILSRRRIASHSKDNDSQLYTSIVAHNEVKQAKGLVTFSAFNGKPILQRLNTM